MSFQGLNETLSEKLEAFVRKLALWIENVNNKKYATFRLHISVEDKPNDKFSEEIVCHISQLKMELMHYFPDVTSCAYSINPFFFDPADIPVGTGEQKELIDI